VPPILHGAAPPWAAELARHRAELPAEQFDMVAAAADGGEALVATGLMQVAARSVTRSWASATCTQTSALTA
jgi:vancomycin aglycone glucosyltransferase